MIDKAKIIDAIKKTDDEFILSEINQLLQNEIDIPNWHKKVLKQRLKDFEEGNAVFHDWEDVRKSVFTSR